MFRGLGAGDVLKCWFPILPIIRLVVFFGPRAIYQEPLKVLSEANKSSTVKEPVCGLLGTWETTDVLNVAGFPPPHRHRLKKKQAACALMERRLYVDSVSALMVELRIVKDDSSSLHIQEGKSCKEEAVKLLQGIFTSPTVLIGVSVKPH